MSELVIKNGKLVLADKVFEGDISIDNGRISGVGVGLSGDEVIDAKGSYAVASSGITTVLDMPNTKPPTTTLGGSDQHIVNIFLNGR